MDVVYYDSRKWCDHMHFLIVDSIRCRVSTWNVGNRLPDNVDFTWSQQSSFYLLISPPCHIWQLALRKAIMVGSACNTMCMDNITRNSLQSVPWSSFVCRMHNSDFITKKYSHVPEDLTEWAQWMRDIEEQHNYKISGHKLAKKNPNPFLGTPVKPEKF